jgi:hypothetical protein
MPNDELPVNHEEHTRLKREFYDKIRQRSSNPLDEILLPFLSVPVVRPDGTRVMESVAAIQKQPGEAPVKPADASVVSR